MVNPTFTCSSPNALWLLSLGNFSSGPTERRANKRRVMMGEVRKQMPPDQRSGEREASLGAHISIWQRALPFLRHSAPLADQALLS